VNRALLYSVLALGLAMVACTAPAEPGAGGAGGSADSTSTSGPGSEAADELAFSDSEITMAVVRLGLARPDSYLPDELALADQSAVVVADLLYDGLTEVVGLEGRLRPGLAQSWSTNEDFTEWRFSLDTERITGAEVANHFQGLLDDINPAVSPLLADVARVEAVGEAEVQFELDGSNAALPWLLSGVGLSVVGADGSPTGRYRVETDSDDQLNLVAAEESSGWPTIAIEWADDDNDAYELLTLGMVDGAVAPALSLEDARARFGFVPAARSISRFYGIDASSPPLDDERVVEAVLHAVDRGNVVGTTAFAVEGLIAPSVAGYRPDGCGEACSYQPEVAASLVEEIVSEGGDSGTGGEPPLLRIAYSGDEQQEVAEAIAADLEAVGFIVDLEAKTAFELAEAIATGTTDLYAFGWLAGAGSVDAIVPQLFGSGSPTNTVGYDSAEVDDLIAQASVTSDDDARWLLLIEAQRLALEEGRILPLAVAKSHLVVAPQASALIVRADGSLDIEASL
jgi:ABC-type transport system substrate-binding protein